MHVESVLEFEALRELVGRYVRSPLGRAELACVAPAADRAAIEDALADLAEAVEYVRTASLPQAASRGAAIRLDFSLPIDPAPFIARLRIEGATLEGHEILELARLLDVAAEARSILTSAGERFPRLSGYGAALADLGHLARELRGKILPDGSLADEASVALARLRRDAERQRRLIEESLARFLRAHHEDGTLQEDFVTIRNDRFVVPVVTGRERRVEGVIHGSSGSGHTVFVEPLETIDLNNELVRVHEEELREVHRILREFTAGLRKQSAEIGATGVALGRLDLIFAKADFARDFECSVPRLSPADAHRLVLRGARHPLLQDFFRRQKKRVVPVSLSLDDRQRTLLISGPNTGGKTVALKTVGLLAAMTHAGLPVPAEVAEFPLYDQILADVGDNQSLAESLSSFSAHIMSVRSMLERATAESLILLDELGRATDPEEGGALAVVILDEFRKSGAFTLASTHLMALKVYGATAEGVVNGSMGFDEATLEPTYVLRLGAPGKSAGLDIALRLGLEPALIESARVRMSSNERDVARLLAELHTRIEALETDRSALAEQKRVLDAREQALEQTWERKYAAKIREIEQQAARLASDFDQRARETIEELSQKARARIARTQREYREAVETLAPPATAKITAANPTAPPLRLETGVRIRLKGIRQPATVRRIAPDGSIEVDAGLMKMRVGASDIEEILPGPAPEQRPSGIGFRQAGPSFSDSYREINIIGQRAEEACAQVEKFLDNAAVAQVERVRIVHGHGMGILKRSIADLLKDSPHVAKFYAATPQEGGTGATIAEMK
jgi:DNA mismatch repair protein MutS2